MRVRSLLPALAFTVLLGLAGCAAAPHRGAAPGGSVSSGSDSSGSGSGGAGSASAAGNGAGAPAAVPASLTFTATTLDGKRFDGTSLAGHPVVLWFWAPWCATCASEAQTLPDLATEYKGKVEIVGVAGMGQVKEMHQFVSDFDLGRMTHLSDDAGVVWKKFGVTEQSVYVLLDRRGKVVAKGWLDNQQIGDQMAKLAAA
ncbi:redoxin domain-containing protein [Planosporangium thailandense]|uniref:Redoxin domain-containing protein n=1 Tax=Planosporangium thailandense TaxID=765197 RepID=A0ABX0Y711_9ACTN|nr:redoxin domain-containing protein [Planosporangium thailandense]NJC74204.1 redoxin domain-containing protein [Planosporangium thailandense]